MVFVPKDCYRKCKYCRYGRLVQYKPYCDYLKTFIGTELGFNKVDGIPCEKGPI